MGTKILQKGQIKKHLSRKVKLGNVLLAGIKWNGCPKCIVNSSHPFNEMDVLHIPWKNILSNNFDEKCGRAQDGCPLKQWFLTYPSPPWNYIEFHILCRIFIENHKWWQHLVADKQASHHCGKEGQVRRGKKHIYRLWYTMYRWKISVNKWQIYHMSSLILVTSSKKYCILYCWHRNGVVFSTLSKHALYILPISWWLDISTCFRFSSKSSADQAGEKPCDLSATRDSPQARFDATTGTDAARLPGDFTSWTPWIGQASKTVTFTTTSHMSFHRHYFSHCLPTRTIEPKETCAYPLHVAHFFVAFQM